MAFLLGGKDRSPGGAGKALEYHRLGSRQVDRRRAVDGYASYFEGKNCNGLAAGIVKPYLATRIGRRKTDAGRSRCNVDNVVGIRQLRRRRLIGAKGSNVATSAANRGSGDRRNAAGKDLLCKHCFFLSGNRSSASPPTPLSQRESTRSQRRLGNAALQCRAIKHNGRKTAGACRSHAARTFDFSTGRR